MKHSSSVWVGKIKKYVFKKMIRQEKVQCYITLVLLQSVVKIRFKFLATSRKKNNHMVRYVSSTLMAVNSFVFAIRALPYSLPVF